MREQSHGSSSLPQGIPKRSDLAELFVAENCSGAHVQEAHSAPHNFRASISAKSERLGELGGAI